MGASAKRVPVGQAAQLPLRRVNEPLFAVAESAAPKARHRVAKFLPVGSVKIDSLTTIGQTHSLVVGSVCALEGVERSLSGLSLACRGLIGVCIRALNGVSGAPPRGWEGIGRRSVAFGSGLCWEAPFRDGVKSYVDVWRALASRHRRGATRSGRLRRGCGRSRR